MRGVNSDTLSTLNLAFPAAVAERSVNNAMKRLQVLFFSVVIAVLPGCSTTVSDRLVVDGWKSEAATDMSAFRSGGPVEVQPVSLSTGAVSRSGQPYVGLAITNISNVSILISKRAVLFPKGTVWERDFETSYYFVGTQLSAPEVPSIASSFKLDAGSGGIYSITPIDSFEPFKLEFVCFPTLKGALAKLSAKTRGERYLGESFIITTPPIEPSDSPNEDSAVAPSS